MKIYFMTSRRAITESNKKNKEVETTQINNLLNYKTYSEKNLEEIIKQFLNDAKKLLDSKFILIIPPEIEQYLSWGSNKKGIRKAEIVRQAVEEFMAKDED